MIRQFEKLSAGERDLLMKAPALISVHASLDVNQINAVRKADAIKLAHLKTFTADALLIPYYIEVEQVFKEQLEAIVKQYTPLDREKKYMLIKEIESIHPILKKLDNVYAHSLRQSLNKFARHVQHADRSVFEYFIFPYPLPGLTD